MFAFFVSILYYTQQFYFFYVVHVIRALNKARNIFLDCCSSVNKIFEIMDYLRKQKIMRFHYIINLHFYTSAVGVLINSFKKDDVVKSLWPLDVDVVVCIHALTLVKIASIEVRDLQSLKI